MPEGRMSTCRSFRVMDAAYAAVKTPSALVVRPGTGDGLSLHVHGAAHSRLRHLAAC